MARSRQSLPPVKELAAAARRGVSAARLSYVARRSRADNFGMAVALRAALGRGDDAVDVGAHKGDVTRQILSSAPDGRLLRCRSCRGVTDHADADRNGRACRHCGDALRWECPICHRDHWVDEPRCTCGFRLELREPMLRHFEAAQYCSMAPCGSVARPSMNTGACIAVTRPSSSKSHNVIGAHP